MTTEPSMSGTATSESQSLVGKRLLFIAEAVTLAHVARIHALAEAMEPEGCEICVAADPRYDALFASSSIARRAITTIPTARFRNALERGAPIYDAATLSSYVEEDLRLIANVAPDIVIGDFRLSLNISAALARKPYINITNAGWSPYASARFLVPDLAFLRLTGLGLGQWLFDRTRPIAFGLHSKPLNATRKRFGLPPLAGDLRTTYTEADQVLYADVPALFPTHELPEHHAFMGAVLWSPAIALPDWWSAIPADRPVIYVTLGSSGPKHLLDVLLDALASMPVTVIASVIDRAPRERLDNVYEAPYLPGEAASARAQLVVCNGGSPSCYQAFAAGVPVLGIPSNLDQFLNMAAVEATGAGLIVRTQALSASTIVAAVRRLLDDERFTIRSRTLQKAVDAIRPGDVLGAAIRRVA